MKRVFSALAIVLILAGCAGQKKVIQSEPIEVKAVAPVVTEVPVQEGTIPTTEHYFVTYGDTLWDIAAVKYRDAFQWPSIWHANRDQISDPDIIEVGQNLVIPRDSSVEEARLEASDWPPYKAHKKH